MKPPSRFTAALRELWGARLRPSESTPEEGLAHSSSVLSTALERVRRGSDVARFVLPAGPDQIVGAGEPFEVTATLDLLRGQLARAVRFYDGDRVLGETEVRESSTVFLDRAGARPGLHLVTHEVLGPAGTVLRGRDPQRAVRVQVCDETPVLAVDASLLFAEDETRARALAALTELTLFYFDLHDADRTAEVHQRIAALGLPDAAVRMHPLGPGMPRTLGADFRHVFARSTMRRLQAARVPVVGVVAGDVSDWDFCASEGLLAVDADDLAAGTGELAAEAARRAAALRGRFDGADPLDVRLDLMTRTEAVAGNSLAVELDNRRARERVLAAIDGATRSVCLQVYILEEGRFASQLGVALVRAARRGVRVCLVIDALYSRQGVLWMRNAMAEGLAQEPGVEVVAADPLDTPERIDAARLKLRDHKKLLVVDDEVAFVSGRNAGDAYYTGFDEVAVADFTPHEQIPWLDAHVEVRGPLVAAVQHTFADAFERGGGAPIHRAIPGEPAGASRARLVVHEGLVDADAMAAYEAILDSAQRHVLVVNDFPVVATLAAAARRAVARGVRVVLLTGNGIPRRGDGTFFRGPLHREVFEHMTKRRLEPLMDVGVEVLEVQTEPQPGIVSRGGVLRPYVHAKVMSSDGVVASIGSANLDVTASYWEREANVVIQDPAVVGPLEDELFALVGHAHRVDRDSDSWRSESTLRELASRLWPDALYS